MDLYPIEAGQLREHVRDLARGTQAIRDALGDKPDADTNVDAQALYERRHTSARALPSDHDLLLRTQLPRRLHRP